MTRPRPAEPCAPPRRRAMLPTIDGLRVTSWPGTHALSSVAGCVGHQACADRYRDAAGLTGPCPAASTTRQEDPLLNDTGRRLRPSPSSGSPLDRGTDGSITACAGSTRSVRRSCHWSTTGEDIDRTWGRPGTQHERADALPSFDQAGRASARRDQPCDHRPSSEPQPSEPTDQLRDTPASPGACVVIPQAAEHSAAPISGLLPGSGCAGVGHRGSVSLIGHQSRRGAGGQSGVGAGGIAARCAARLAAEPARKDQ
jgi:hypothetical protein